MSTGNKSSTGLGTVKIIVPQGETTRSLIPLEQKQLRISEIGSRENEVRGLSLKEDHTVTFLNFYRLPYQPHHTL